MKHTSYGLILNLIRLFEHLEESCLDNHENDKAS